MVTALLPLSRIAQSFQFGKGCFLATNLQPGDLEYRNYAFNQMQGAVGIAMEEAFHYPVYPPDTYLLNQEYEEEDFNKKQITYGIDGENRFCVTAPQEWTKDFYPSETCGHLTINTKKGVLDDAI